MWPEWFWFFLVMLAFFAGMGAMWLIEREIANEREAVLYEALRGMVEIYGVPVDSVEKLRRHNEWLKFVGKALADGPDA